MANAAQTVRFVFSDKTGTFSNINAYLYFAAQKNEHIGIVLDENNVLESLNSHYPEPVISFDNGPPHWSGNRPRLEPIHIPRGRKKGARSN